jgi:hypothetical protein
MSQHKRKLASNEQKAEPGTDPGIQAIPSLPLPSQYFLPQQEHHGADNIPQTQPQYNQMWQAIGQQGTSLNTQSFFALPGMVPGGQSNHSNSSGLEVQYNTSPRNGVWGQNYTHAYVPAQWNHGSMLETTGDFLFDPALIRQPVGTSIEEPDSIFNIEIGRTYNRAGYIVPNDPVSFGDPHVNSPSERHRLNRIDWISNMLRSPHSCVEGSLSLP